MSAPAASAAGLERLDEERGPDWLEQRLRVPPTLPCLEGHFPGMPILPGLAQLAWAVEAAGRLGAGRSWVSRLEALKFRELLRPGDVFSARAERRAPPADGDGLRVSFELRREGRTAASGRLCLGGADPASDGLGRTSPCEPLDPGDPWAGRPARDLVPHAGPMVFVDALIAAAPRRTVCGLAVERRTLFRQPDGSLPGWAGLEAMAQCIAAHGGLEARRRGGEPRVGFLLGCRRLEIGVDRLSAGVPYAVSAEQVWGGEEGLVSFDCELFERDGGRRLLAGRINAYLPAEDGWERELEGPIGG